MNEDLNKIVQTPVGIPQTPPPMMNAPIHKDRSAGPVVGIIIIILVIVLGGLYFWGERILKERGESAEMIQNAPDQERDALLMQDQSDETASIETDLEATSLNSLEADLGNIEAQFQE